VRPMGSLTSLTDPAALIAADASTVINLNATGCAPEIIRALPNKLVVVDVVAAELDEGRRRGRPDAALLNQLVAAGHVEIVKLNDSAALHFEKLVIGPAAMTLDDGEAATIAYAVVHKGTAVLDERKATRICAEAFPKLHVGCTVDILAHPEVRKSLGKEMLADAVFKALCNGRMRVFPHHVAWVVGLIGTDHAAACTSLPNSVRKPQQGVTGLTRKREK
jgi:predicted nucleic acid-binding protein